jgi:hypothetical protein
MIFSGLKAVAGYITDSRTDDRVFEALRYHESATDHVTIELLELFLRSGNRFEIWLEGILFTGRVGTVLGISEAPEEVVEGGGVRIRISCLGNSASRSGSARRSGISLWPVFHRRFASFRL